MKNKFVKSLKEFVIIILSMYGPLLVLVSIGILDGKESDIPLFYEVLFLFIFYFVIALLIFLIYKVFRKFFLKPNFPLSNLIITSILVAITHLLLQLFYNIESGLFFLWYYIVTYAIAFIFLSVMQRLKK